jgi:hypothetical protein
MRELAVNIQQRLNLISLLGQQRGTVADIPLWSGVIDKLELAEGERAAIQLHADPQRPGILLWDATAAIAAGSKTVKISGEEAGKLRLLCQSWPNFVPADYQWLLPLLGAL